MFGPKRAKHIFKNSLSIVIENTELPKLDKAKTLGIVLDTDLRFEDFINCNIGKGYSILKTLYSNRHCLPRKTKAMLCDSLILSLLNYADVLYGPCLTSLYKGKIQKLQNSCLRFIYGIRRGQRISYKLKEAGWLSMADRRYLHAACMFHSIILSKTPLYLHRKISFRTDVHNVNIRSKGLLTTPVHKTELFKRSFRYQIGKVYNGLKRELQGCSVMLFRLKLKKILLLRQTF